jgi:hypothetical protein
VVGSLLDDVLLNPSEALIVGDVCYSSHIRHVGGKREEMRYDLL